MSVALAGCHHLLLVEAERRAGNYLVRAEKALGVMELNIRFRECEKAGSRMSRSEPSYMVGMESLFSLVLSLNLNGRLKITDRNPNPLGPIAAEVIQHSIVVFGLVNAYLYIQCFTIYLP